MDTAQEDGFTCPLRTGYDIQAPVYTITAVHVRSASWAEHRAITLCDPRPSGRVRRRVARSSVRFGLHDDSHTHLTVEP